MTPTPQALRGWSPSPSPLTIFSGKIRGLHSWRKSSGGFPRGLFPPRGSAPTTCIDTDPPVTSQRLRRAGSQQGGPWPEHRCCLLAPRVTRSGGLPWQTPVTVSAGKTSARDTCEHSRRLTDWPTSTAAHEPRAHSGIEERGDFSFLISRFFNSICRAFALTPHSSHRFLTFSISHLSWSVSNLVQTTLLWSVLHRRRAKARRFGEIKTFSREASHGLEMRKITTWSKSTYLQCKYILDEVVLGNQLGIFSGLCFVS